ncbi:hypothetical protein Q5762_35750 [Streptomyces sp. P9(2023)]|uniref:hypothetical protein n=1 Tax=Streptomyces sp. P9(2023) TaxID=3064394 RepID=UPI0028F405A6|nr:hypothetical protein [Streptomyces sp. P9(2023)]MDT9693583.1 hypothetical protein [Streptomyces sp. P9(2023)]
MTARVHGVDAELGPFTADPDDRRAAARWLEPLLLDDGTRFLATAGRWPEAASNADRFDPAPERLHQARQSRIVAHTLADRQGAARGLLDSSVPSEAWEAAVRACLGAFSSLHSGGLAPQEIDWTLRAVHAARLDDAPATARFRLRLGVLSVELLSASCPTWPTRSPPTSSPRYAAVRTPSPCERPWAAPPYGAG